MAELFGTLSHIADMKIHHKDPFTLKDLLDGEKLYSLVTGFVLLGFSFVTYHFANAYAVLYLARSTTTFVGDIFLDNIPVIDLNFIIIEFALITSAIFAVYLLFFKPSYALFSLKALAVFNITRALFISLTHMGDYPGHLVPGPGLIDGIFSYFDFQTGFFFSAHTGLPFLFALIFWKEPVLRYLFLSLSFVFGIAVLLGHVHYSIDVFAAPFMAYGVFRIVKYFFPHDYKLIEPPHV